jgi:hypothetical protein
VCHERLNQTNQGETQHEEIFIGNEIGDGISKRDGGPDGE